MKRKLFSKVLSCVLVLCMVLSLAACQGPADDETSGAPDNGTAGGNETTVGEEREHVELVWYTLINKDMPGKEATIKAINEYLKEKLNTTLDIHFYLSSEYSDTVSTIVSSGQDFDIVTSGSGRVDFSTFADRNAFAPLNEYVDEYLSGTKELLPEASWDAYTIDGNIYAVPPIKDLADQWCMIINQDMVDELGVAFPEKYDTGMDVLDFLYEVKAARDAKYPEKANQPLISKNLQNLEAFYNFEAIIGARGTTMLAANVPGLLGFEGMGDGETLFCPVFTDEYRELMKTMRKLVVDGIVPFDTATFDSDKVLYNAGELLGEFNLGYIYWDEDTYMPAFKSTLYTESSAMLTTSTLQTGGMAISAESKNIERALEVVELLNTDPYLATVIRFGPEGTGWTDKDNDNVIELTDLNSDASNRYWYYWYGWNVGNMTASKVPTGYPANFGEMVQELNSSATAGSNLGFIMDKSGVENEIAACNNVWSEFYKTLFSGQNDNVDELVDEFQAKLIDNGIETIMAEGQRQLDEWRAAQGLPTK